MKNKELNRLPVSASKFISKFILIIRYIILGFNFIALAGGIAYLIHPTAYLLWNLYGYIILLALLGNIALVCLTKKFRRLNYCYIILHIISMFLIPVVNTIVSSDVNNKTSQSIFVLVLYNILFIFGLTFSFLQIKNKIKNDKPDSKKETQPGRIKNILRRIAVVLSGFILLFGIYLSYILLGKSTGNMIEVFIPEYSVFWGLFILGASVLIVKLLHINKRPVFNGIVLSLGIIINIICFIPLMSIPYLIKNADKAYGEAFGDFYLQNKTAEKQNGFMRSRFSLQNYLLGTRTSGYIIKENILYYEGTEGRDAGIKLHFDAYIPQESGGNFKRKNSVLIRIHGGAWTMGDKGYSNYSGTNKHFVNLGYTVFDIQYGINNQNPSFANDAVPASVKGNFDIDDMVRHIGIFTKFLSDHSDEYSADINSVFISGASAGGQLAAAAALGITGGKYTNILDPRLRIRGLIPFYPANSLSPNVGIGGAPDLVDPAALVDKESPPCLIYHGTHDGIVNPKYASILLQTYNEKSIAPCALIWMNFASHGSDFYTPGYYNQIFLYYMERFMHQYK